jgi:hypothetical protein
MSKFFKLSTGTITINNNKKSDIIQDFKIFEEHNKTYYKIKNSNSNVIKYVKNEKYDIDISSINDVNYIVSIFGMNDAGILNRADDDNYPKFMIGGNNKPILSEKTDMKFKNIMTTELNKKDNLIFSKIIVMKEICLF